MISYEDWPGVTHHLALTRLLQIGFCKNQAFGMPSMQTLSQVFGESSSAKNFTAGLEAARPRLGTPVKNVPNLHFVRVRV
jgi:hypothetical protein